MTTRGGKKPQRGSWSSHSSRRLGRRHSCADLYPGTCWLLPPPLHRQVRLTGWKEGPHHLKGIFKMMLNSLCFSPRSLRMKTCGLGWATTHWTWMVFNVALIYSLRISYIDTMYVDYVLPLTPSTPSHPTSPDHPCVFPHS